MPANLTRKAVEQQLKDHQVPEPVCATVRALLIEVQKLRSEQYMRATGRLDTKDQAEHDGLWVPVDDPRCWTKPLATVRKQVRRG